MDVMGWWRGAQPKHEEVLEGTRGRDLGVVHEEVEVEEQLEEVVAMHEEADVEEVVAVLGAAHEEAHLQRRPAPEKSSKWNDGG